MIRNLLLWQVCIAFNVALSSNLFSQQISNLNPIISILEGEPFYLHEIIEGQELSQIAVAYGVEVSQILKANSSLEKGFEIGERIKIPYSDRSLEAFAAQGAMRLEDTHVAVPTIIFDEAFIKSDRSNAQPSKDSIKAIPTPLQEAVNLFEQNQSVASDNQTAPNGQLASSDLLELSNRIKESLTTLELMKKALDAGPTEVPAIQFSQNEEHDFVIDFLEQFFIQRFRSDSSINEFYLKEFFSANINPNGVIVSLKDERTETNANTRKLNVEEIAGLTLNSYPNLEQKSAITPIGLIAEIDVHHYRLKVKRKNIMVYRGAFYADHLQKDHKHYEMIMNRANELERRGKCTAIIWDGFIYTARYTRMEYNPFGKLTDIIDERRIQEIVALKF